jgi:hypothetical protein
MTREEMVKRRWKPYEIIYVNAKGELIECMLCGINFDTEMALVSYIWDSPFNPYDAVEVHIKYIETKKSILHT